jgi:hypothetical protein
MLIRLLLVTALASMNLGCGASCYDVLLARTFDLIAYCGNTGDCETSAYVPPSEDEEGRPIEDGPPIDMTLVPNQALAIPLRHARDGLMEPRLFVVANSDSEITAPLRIAFDGQPAPCAREARPDDLAFGCVLPEDAQQLEIVYGDEHTEYLALRVQAYLEEESPTKPGKACYR